MKKINDPDHSDAMAGHLIDKIINGRHKAGDLSSAIDMFYRSRNLIQLERLLNGNQLAQVNGIYILSEIGNAGRPLLSRAVEFTAHPNWEARLLALDCILSCAEPSDGYALAAGVRLTEDSNDPVRRQAVDFVSRLTSTKLEAARKTLLGHQGDSALADMVSRLLSYSADFVDEILADTKSEEWLRRASAMAFAKRSTLVVKKIARKAARSSDPVTADLAKTLS